eukprot:CAMPEP_0197524578 /NCGR_PEP_ID=MMETSP1318-20131121/9210_1 /TAXON_ID=552666 /ORGANISM="Partenskyella glossopodia, Strain RCC365" /LENGTH=193 /DNA_ID=CAMNT_0043077555 /DNA_START=189 /DNA_END=770 /DNA_ORIENTATION=-
MSQTGNHRPGIASIATTAFGFGFGFGFGAAGVGVVWAYTLWRRGTVSSTPCGGSPEHCPRTEPGQVQVFCDDGEWISMEPPGMSEEDKGRVLVRKLYTEKESGRYSLELKMEPNTGYPDHWHTSAEWCFVKNGSFSDEYGVKTKGDFFYNEKGSSHRAGRSGPNGAVLLVVKDKGTNIPMLEGQHRCPLEALA